MKSTSKLRTGLLASLFIGLGQGAPAWGDATDYEFQLVETTVQQGNSAIVAVRLVDKRTSKVVPDAVIFSTRLDMAPDGMEMMATTVEPMPSDEPGVYRFTTNLSMAGGWQLSVAAKVQGEPETVSAKLVLKAVQ